MIALVVVRNGVLPAGAIETVAECAGRAVITGSATMEAAGCLSGFATELWLAEAATTGPGGLAAALAPVLADEPIIVLPASPDGRDLAPRLATRMHRPLLANAVRVTDEVVETVTGTDMQRHRSEPPFVATLVPGVRGALAEATRPPTVTTISVDLSTGPADATCVEVLPPDPATIDLAEAARILGGGAGLDSPERFEQLALIGAAFGASVGATRVITDRHWMAHDRQIGTTGVMVDPQLYIAFGISGAVQHTSGLGQPAHVISVNTDPHCPMMQMADIAVVADANAVLDALAVRVAT